ncbi:MAG: PDZ domain-containing protein [Isosphaeraceae bacterium]
MSRVLDGSPAARGGLRVGDEIVRINGRRMTTLKDAAESVGAVRAGDVVRLLVRRRDADRKETDGGEQPVAITAGEGL